MQIRTLGMLRSRFSSLPHAFNNRLVSLKVTIQPYKLHLEEYEDYLATLYKHLTIILIQVCDRKTQHAKFAQLWNEVILSFREEDIISNK